MKENRFILFSAGYNCREWVKRHMKLAQTQTYRNYVHVIVDDATNDGTYEEILEWKDEKTVVYRNAENMGWIHNAAKYIEKHIESPEDIIVGYDLDDWFAHDGVLERVNEIYNKKDCWVTYGGFVRSNGRMMPGNWLGYPDNVIRRRIFKEHNWRFWAMRTWKAFLWNEIDKEDFKGPDGKWPKTTYDYAIAFPLLEMCSEGRLHYVGNEEVLYIYNYANPLNDKKINKAEQVRIGKHYLRRKVYDVYDGEGGLTEGEREQFLRETIKKRAKIKLPETPEGVEENRFIIFSAGANCKHFVKKHMESVSSQKYKNYIHIN